MASVKTWSTKEEVLKDLARASGRRIKKNDDLDEGYFVVGDAPPPVLVEDEDDQMNLLFGDAAYKKVAQTEDATPDLLGIQQMLQMVHDFSGSDDDDLEFKHATKPSDCVIAISKTNANNEHSSKKDIAVETTAVDVDVNSIKPNEYQDIATKLKNQISDAAKSDSFEFKKQKNVAIATLLRLYAKNNQAPQDSTAPLKLITPEYFEGKKEDKCDVKIISVNKEPVAVSSETSTSSTPEPKNSSTSIPSGSSNSISSTPLKTSSDSHLPRAGTPIKPETKIDPEIKRSIEKVNKWLGEPSKSKSPAVCLGPIAFKRKDPGSCKSPTSDSEQKISKSSSSGQRYQPSNYAADLGRKYMERSKIEEEKKKEVTWSNLGDILKQKDLAIEKRLREKATASDSNDDLPQR